MADNIEIVVEIQGIESVKKMGAAFERMTATLLAATDAAYAMKELQGAIDATTAKTKSFDKMAESVAAFGNSANRMAENMNAGFQSMNAQVQRQLEVFKAGIEASAKDQIANAISTAKKTAEITDASAAANLQKNVKYAEQLSAATRQILDKGTSGIQDALHRRSMEIARILTKDGENGKIIATKAYGSDFVKAVEKGMAEGTLVLKSSNKLREEMMQAHNDAVLLKATVLEQRLNDEAAKTEAGLTALKLKGMNARIAVIREEYVAVEKIALANEQAQVKAAEAQIALEKRILKAKEDGVYAGLAIDAKAYADKLAAQDKLVADQIALEKRILKAKEDGVYAGLALDAKAYAEKLATQDKLVADQVALEKRILKAKEEGIYAGLAIDAKAYAEKLAAQDKLVADQIALDKRIQKAKEEGIYAGFAIDAKAYAEKLAADDKLVADQVALEKRILKAKEEGVYAGLALDAKAYAEKLAAQDKLVADQISLEKRIQKAKEEGIYARLALDAKEAEESARIKDKLLANSARRQVDLAMREPAGAYSISEGSRLKQVVNPIVPIPPVDPKVPAGLKDIHLNASAANSAIRGLTQGFGMLSSTVSSMLPFMASFIAASAVMKTLKVGAEFEKSMFVISELAGVSSSEIGKVKASLLELGATSSYGPLEAAKGLEILTLAGLSAKDALKALRPTLDFSAAGDVSMEAAAATLVAVSTAYRFTADQFSTVGDIIAKTAADTMTSVAGMSESFKTASVIAQTYNVTITDTAQALGALAQIGITGSAAGTSLRNFYTEITKTAGQAGAAIKALNVEIRETSGENIGQLKSLLEISKQVSIGLINKTPKAQTQLFAALSNERGGKTLSAELALGQAELRKLYPELEKTIAGLRATGGEAAVAAFKVKSIAEAYDSLIEKQKEANENAAGFTFFASVEAQLTSLGSYKGILASLQVDFVKAFESSSDAVYILGQTLRDVFNSKEFQDGLTTLVRGLVSLVEYGFEAIRWAVEFKNTALGLGMAVTTVVSAGSAMLPFLSSLVSTLVMATPEIGLAAAGMGVLSAAFAASPLLMTAVVAGAVYLIYQLVEMARAYIWVGNEAEQAADKQAKAQKKSLEDSTKAGDLKIKKSIEAFETELKSLILLQEERDGKLKKGEAADKIMAEQAIRRVNEVYDEKRALIQLVALEELRANLKEGYVVSKALEMADTNQVKRLTDNERERNAVLTKQANLIFEIGELKRKQAAYDLAQASQKGKNPGATDTSGLPPKPKFEKRDPIKAREYTKSNEFEQYQKESAALLGELKDRETKERAILESQHKNKLISEAEYESRAAAMAEQFSEEKLAKLKIDAEESERITREDLAKLTAAQAAFYEANKNNKSFDVGKEASQFAQEILNKQNSLKTVLVANSAEVGKTGTEMWLRQMNAANAYRGRLLAIAESLKEIMRVEAANDVIKTRATAYRDEERYAESPEALAIIQARNAAQERWLVLGDADAKRIAELISKQGELNALMENNTITPQTLAAVKDTNKELDELIEKRKALLKLSGDKGSAAATDKELEIAKDKLKTFTDDIAGGVRLGITDGADAGADALRRIIMNKLAEPIVVLVNAVVNSITNGAMDLIGFGPSSLSGGGSGGGGMLGAVAGGKSIYDAIAGGFTAFGDKVGLAYSKLATSSVGQSMGLSSVAESESGQYMVANGAGTVSTWAGYAGGAMAGIGIGSALGGDRKLNGLTSTETSAIGVVAAAAITYFSGGVLSGAALAIGGAIGGAIDGILGKGDVKLNEYRIKGSLGASGANAGLETITEQKGGWFSSPDIQGEGKIVKSDNLTTYLNVGISAITTATKEYAKVLGLNANAIDGFTQEIMVSLKDLSPADQQKAISDALGGFGDAMVGTAYGSILKALVTPGSWTETTGLKDQALKDAEASNNKALSDTLVRLAKNLITVNSIFDLLNYTLLEGSIAGAQAAEAMIAAFGGMDKFTQSMQSYYTNFYTDAEKQINTLDSVAAAIDKAGGSTSGTALAGMSRADYRGMVEKAKKDFGESSPLFVALVQMSEAFAQVVPAADAAKDAIDNITKVLESLASEKVNLTAAIQTARGDKKGAFFTTNKLGDPNSKENEGVSKAYDDNQALSNTLSVLNKITEMGKTIQQQGVDWLTAKGDIAGAAALTKTLALAGVDLTTVEGKQLEQMYDQIEATKKLIAVESKITELNKSNASLQVDLLTSKGDLKGAAALTKQLALAEFDLTTAEGKRLEQSYDQLEATKALIAANNLANDQSKTLKEHFAPKTMSAATAMGTIQGSGLFTRSSLAELESKGPQGIKDIIRTMTEDAVKLGDAGHGTLQMLTDLTPAFDILTGEADKLFNELESNIKTLQDGITELNPAPVARTLQQIKDLANTMGTLDLSMIKDALGSAQKIKTTRDDLQTARNGIPAMIEKIRIDNASVANKPALLKGKVDRLRGEFEANPTAELFNQLRDATIDHVIAVGAASKEAENKLNQTKLDGLNKQLDAAEKLKDFAEGLKQTVSNLKTGDLSALNFKDQLAESERLYNETLQKAKGGDTVAQGNLATNAQQYLQEARDYFGQVGKPYGDIFSKVTGDLSGMADTSTGSDADRQIQAIKDQIKATEDVLAATNDTSEDQIKALEDLGKLADLKVAGLTKALGDWKKVLDDQLVIMTSARDDQAQGLTDAAARDFIANQALREMASSLSTTASFTTRSSANTGSRSRNIA